MSETPKDLLLTLPLGGVDRSRKASIRDVALPGMATVEVTVGRPPAAPPPRGGADPTGSRWRMPRRVSNSCFFHGRDEYLTRTLPTGSRRIVSGKVELFDGIAQMPHPDHILPPEEADEIPVYEPVYPLTSGVTQKGIRKAVASALERAPVLGGEMDRRAPDGRRSAGPSGTRRCAQSTRPPAPRNLSRGAPARERLAFDELFAHQLTAGAGPRDAEARQGAGDGGLRAAARARAGKPAL